MNAYVYSDDLNYFLHLLYINTLDENMYISLSLLDYGYENESLYWNDEMMYTSNIYNDKLLLFDHDWQWLDYNLECYNPFAG